MSRPDRTQPACRAILLHEAPDLDAAFGSWLLTRFGNEKYPGAATASLLFYPVHKLPGGLSADELEVEGIIAVDTGQGRFDNHGASSPTSSAMLVAQDLGIVENPALKKLLEFVHRNDIEGRGMRSSDSTDHAIALPNILRGLKPSPLR